MNYKNRGWPGIDDGKVSVDFKQAIDYIERTSDDIITLKKRIKELEEENANLISDLSYYLSIDDNDDLEEFRKWRLKNDN